MPASAERTAVARHIVDASVTSVKPRSRNGAIHCWKMGTRAALPDTPMPRILPAPRSTLIHRRQASVVWLGHDRAHPPVASLQESAVVPVLTRTGASAI